ncbi:hypothetical protein [Nonomuraea pusilla]|uniref:Uncharacterized protein n=1 Tax=Nonomuraea pusilla TaxID=46177 RepID=A0A1H8APZ4_9ACTN|nr:hypothetical protein [Nonomuraea pusilla]SEM72800.1 hypothetical protein SAMN05660976_05939 [Nonomuraea pusilla]
MYEMYAFHRADHRPDRPVAHRAEGDRDEAAEALQTALDRRDNGGVPQQLG